MDSSTLKSHSPYKRGADWGAWFGIYLSVLFFVTSYSVSSPVCALIGLLMILECLHVYTSCCVKAMCLTTALPFFHLYGWKVSRYSFLAA